MRRTRSCASRGCSSHCQSIRISYCLNGRCSRWRGPLPWLELALGVTLIAGIWLRYLSIAAAGILAMFFTVMVVSYFRGAGIDCGCFGVGEPLSARTLLRDGALLAAAIVLVAYTRRRANPQSLIPNP